MARIAFALALLAQAAFIALNLWVPGWRLVNLDREHNLPTWFHSALLGLVALLAFGLFRLEGRFLARSGRRRRWAVAWLAVAGGFAYLALDESWVIHEGFFTSELRTWLTPTSPLQLTLAWLFIFLPAIVLTVAFLLASLGARARLSPRLIVWGGAGLGLWVLALTLEATARTFFMPRNLYWLEVILEETAESVGTMCFGWALWRYRLDLRAWIADDALTPAFAVPWRWVLAGTTGLVLPIAVVGASMAWNPYVLYRYVGDDHLRAGRVEDAVRAYRAALAAAPTYGRAWHRLGVAELQRGDLAAAEQAFATAVRLEPRSVSAVNHLGIALLRQGRDGEAATAFAQAVRLAPDDADILQNLGVALKRLGREAEAEAALGRALTLRPPEVQVTDLRVAAPADSPLAYIAHPRIAAALAESGVGGIEAAVAGYRRVLTETPNLAPAHLGLANELVRWRLAAQLTGVHPSARVKGIGGQRARAAALFTDWVRGLDGRWSALEVVVEAPPPADGVALTREARGHFERALALGVGAAAHVGLAAVARLDGDTPAAARHLAAARAADPSLPIPAAAPSPTAAAPR